MGVGLSAEDRAAALAEFGEEEQVEETQDPEAEEEVEETPDSEGGGADGTPDSEEDEDQDPEGAQSEEPPTEYMGLDLSGIDSDRRAALIADLKENDKFIQRLIQRNKELEEQATSGPAEPQTQVKEAEPATDDEILAALGLDPEDPLAELQLPLARKLYEQQMEMQQMEQVMQAQAFYDHFNTVIDQLESTEGKLPDEVTRDDLLDYMAENNIPDPEAAYYRLVAPMKSRLANAISKEREEAKRLAKKRVTTKKAATEQTESKKPDKLLSPREAALAALKEAKVDPARFNPSKQRWAGSI